MLQSTLTRTPDDAPGGTDIAVVRWCGLRLHNAVARFASMASATDFVRRLSEIGVTNASLSTAAVVTENDVVEALIGVHCDDEMLVRRAADLMRDLGGRPCCFASDARPT
ncbi:MAG: hypothetical protein ABIQ73_29955 [Acidimicrobiales bacterium]